MDELQPLTLSLKFMTTETQTALSCSSKQLYSAMLNPAECEARCLTWCDGNVGYVSSLRSALNMKWPQLLTALQADADIVGDYRILNDYSQLALVRAFGGGLHCVVALPPGLDVQVTSVQPHPAAAAPANHTDTHVCLRRKQENTAEASYSWAWSLYLAAPAGTAAAGSGSAAATTGSVASSTRNRATWSLVTPTHLLQSNADKVQPRVLPQVCIDRRVLRSSQSAAVCSSSATGILSDVWTLRGSTEADETHIRGLAAAVFIRVDTSPLVHPRFQAAFQVQPGSTAAMHPVLQRAMTAAGYTCSDYGGHGVEIQRSTIDTPDSPARKLALLAERRAAYELASVRAPATTAEVQDAVDGTPRDASSTMQSTLPTGLSTVRDMLQQPELTCADVSMFSLDETFARACYSASPASAGEAAAHAASGAASGAVRDSERFCLLLRKVSGDRNVVPGALTACVPLQEQGILAAAGTQHNTTEASVEADTPAAPAPAGPLMLHPAYCQRGISFGTLPPEPFPRGLNVRPSPLTSASQSAVLLPIAQDTLTLRSRTLVAGVRPQLDLAWPVSRASSIVSRCFFPMHSWHCGHGVINYEHGSWDPKMEPSFMGIGLQLRFWRDDLRGFWAAEADAIARRSQHWTLPDALEFAFSPQAGSMALQGQSPTWTPPAANTDSPGALEAEIAAAAPSADGAFAHSIQHQAVLALAWMGEHTSPHISHTLVYFPLGVLPEPCLSLESMPAELSSVLSASLKAALKHEEACAESSSGEALTGTSDSSSMSQHGSPGRYTGGELDKVTRELRCVGLLDGTGLDGFPAGLLLVQSLRG